MNASNDASQTRFAPKRSLAQPVSGITLANASRYAVETHWIVGIDAWNSRPSVGIATLTIVASRMVMIVPRTTTAASRKMSRVSTRSGGACDFELAPIEFISTLIISILNIFGRSA